MALPKEGILKANKPIKEEVLVLQRKVVVFARARNDPPPPTPPQQAGRGEEESCLTLRCNAREARHFCVPSATLLRLMAQKQPMAAGCDLDWQSNYERVIRISLMK